MYYDQFYTVNKFILGQLVCCHYCIRLAKTLNPMIFTI